MFIFDALNVILINIYIYIFFTRMYILCIIYRVKLIISRWMILNTSDDQNHYFYFYLIADKIN